MNAAETINTTGDRIAYIIDNNQIKKKDFANRLGITGAYVTHLIQGKNLPSDALVKLICREFNISETWLRTGEGPMQANPMPTEPADDVDRLLDKYDLPRQLHGLLDEYLKLSPEARREIKSMFDNWAGRTAEQAELPSEPPPESSYDRPLTPDEEAELVRQAALRAQNQESSA